MNNKKNEIWISMSDLMTALMMIFLFICISYMKVVKEENEEIKEIALTWEKSQNEIYNALNSEFNKDLPVWGAELEKNTLTIRFKEPSVLFKPGSYELTNAFEDILSDFLPRYYNVLNQYNSEISSVRIEGHTSSDWARFNKTDAYVKNMELSQKRTQSVLNFWIYHTSANKNKISWLKKFVEASGRSSSHLIYNNRGFEDKKKSRRVEFKVKTKTEQKILKILEK